MAFIFGFLGGIGIPELLLIAGIVILMFGGQKIPEIMKGIGKGMKEFKNASNGIENPEEGKQN